MYLKYINNKSIDMFVKSHFCPNAKTIMVENEDRTYVNVFTNLLDTTLHINDFECINLDTNKEYHNEWRQFVIKHLDKLDISKKLSDSYINSLYDYLEQDTIYGCTK